MRVDKTFQEWLKEQERVRWPNGVAGLMCYLEYKDVECAAILTRMYSDGKASIVSANIHPIQSKHDIGYGAGHSEFINFKHESEIN